MHMFTHCHFATVLLSFLFCISSMMSETLCITFCFAIDDSFLLPMGYVVNAQLPNQVGGTSGK